MTPPTPAPRFTITVEAVADPNARHGERYARDPEYRLKLLLKFMLRRLGFRCVRLVPEPPAARPSLHPPPETHPLPSGVN